MYRVEQTKIVTASLAVNKWPTNGDNVGIQPGRDWWSKWSETVNWTTFEDTATVAAVAAVTVAVHAVAKNWANVKSKWMSEPVSERATLQPTADQATALVNCEAMHTTHHTASEQRAQAKKTDWDWRRYCVCVCVGQRRPLIRVHTASHRVFTGPTFFCCAMPSPTFTAQFLIKS